MFIAISAMLFSTACMKKHIGDRKITGSQNELEIKDTVSLNEQKTPSEDEGWQPVSEGSVGESYIDYDNENETVNDSGLQAIYFEFDSSALTEEARSILFQNSRILKEKSDMAIIIEGHCDDRGTDEYNLALGDRRAESAKNYLISMGISASRIQTISYGEELPAVHGETEDAWSKNRRCQFSKSN